MNVSAQTFANKPRRIDLMLRKVLLNKLGKLKNVQLNLTDPLGSYTLGESSNADLIANIQVYDIDFYRRLAVAGSVGAAESYMDQQWQADDLTKLIQIMVRNRDLLDNMEGGLATIANKLLGLWHYSNRNSTEGSRKNIAAHYDLGNDLFKLFLDHHGMYSSATFYDKDTTLEQASTDKLERICQKLDLQQTDHLLEIGTGWGGFAAYAAKHYGCKITTTTISEEQYKAAQQRMQDENLTDLVTVVMQDYRELEGRFDKLVSIEMIEAVGHQYLDIYFKQCAALLKNNGLAMIQAITIEDQRYYQALQSVDFIKRYIFPGSFIPCVSAIIESSARSSDLRLINLEDQGESYALTMKHWYQRFMNHLNEVRELGYNEEFIRMWEFYMAYCEGGFKEKSISSIQILMAKPENRRHQWLPLHEA